jgi:hypothetical protein
MRQEAAPELAGHALARALVVPAMVRAEAWTQPAAPSGPPPGQSKREGQKATTRRTCQPVGTSRKGRAGRPQASLPGAPPADGGKSGIAKDYHRRTECGHTMRFCN